jgi:hypothetical protein
MASRLVIHLILSVIKRHIIHGLETIFSPVIVNNLSPSQAESIASEPASARRQRDFLMERIKKLEDGPNILLNVIGSIMP